jgi:hypothetical protein
MGGGLMQLVAYGAQDIYLTGNPQITFFKVVYRRHTNFAMEPVEQTLSGTNNYGGSVTATVARNGDLVHRMWLEHKAEAATSGDTTVSFCANYGAALVDNVVCEIGGQQIDKHYGHWLEVWAELSQPNSSGVLSTQLITTADSQRTGGTAYQSMTFSGGVNGSADSDGDGESCEVLFLPLQFWFNRNPGLALPLIALQYHEVKVKMTFAAATALNASAALIGTAFARNELWAEYIYLDTDERRRFAQVSHEYLIEQVQYQSEAAATSMTLNFNHPVKELVVAGQGNTTTSATASRATPRSIYTTTTDQTMRLVLNGHDRMADMDIRYYTRMQVLQHHSGFGGVTLGTAGAPADSIAVYSFALKPEEHQPSGTCNFSRIDNAQLKFSASPTNSVDVYAVNYNVLRVMSGMGGLAYSN